MSQAFPEARSVIDMLPKGQPVALYTMTAEQYFRPEIVYLEASFEPPLIVAGQVIFGDPFLGTIANMTTQPALADPVVAASPLAFTFSLSGGWLPSYAARLAVNSATKAVNDVTSFSGTLPETVLGPNQTIVCTIIASNPDGTSADVPLTSAVLVGLDLSDSGLADSVPPYTAQSFALQLDEAAA